jgi:hypothetical protein
MANKASGGNSELLVEFIITIPSPCLPCWLIEPCFDIVLPMLLKVPIRHNIIMLHHGLPAIHRKQKTCLKPSGIKCT